MDCSRVPRAMMLLHAAPRHPALVITPAIQDMSTRSTSVLHGTKRIRTAHPAKLMTTAGAARVQALILALAVLVILNIQRIVLDVFLGPPIPTETDKEHANVWVVDHAVRSADLPLEMAIPTMETVTKVTLDLTMNARSAQTTLLC